MFSFRSNKPSFQNETHQKLAALLLDEYVQVISSFELNQIASLTYGTEVCDEIFEMLEEVIGKPLEYTVLAIQKALVVSKHILIYGSEECVRNAIALGRLVEPLQVYNTVLLQQQRQGATALFYRIKGGGVDKGYPVREVAKQFYDLVSQPERMHQLRHSHADPNSLVPVGDDKVVFVTDEVRLYLLKKRMEEQQCLQGKSNLAKASDGFGSGYNSKDGKAIVGAAHGIEEMLARERREKLKYRDDGTKQTSDSFDTGYQAPDELLAEAHQAAAVVGGGGGGGGFDFDLLSSPSPVVTKSPAPGVDLLDFSTSPKRTTAIVSNATSRDLLSSGGSHDLLGGDLLGLNGSTPASTAGGMSTTTTTDLWGDGMDLLGGGDVTATSTFASSGGGVVDLLGVSASYSSAPSTNTTTVDLLSLSPAMNQPSMMPDTGISSGRSGQLELTIAKKPVMSYSGSNFSALDALELPTTAGNPSSALLFGMAAEQRVLGNGLGNGSIISDAFVAKGPLSELNGLPDMTKLSLNKQPTMESHHLPLTTTTTALPKWGHESLKSDSESSYGFGGSTMGGQVNVTPSNAGLTSFGLTSDPFSGLNNFSSSITQSNSMTPSSIPEFSTPVAAVSGLGVVGSVYGASLGQHDADGGGDDDDSGFVMGGMVGSGLQPTAPPPPVPPPPPPSF